MRSGVPVAVCVAAGLFNLGQGVLRPTLPLYLQFAFAANYRMVTLIPVGFGTGRWIASLPTGFLMDRIGRRRLMAAGLLWIACCDVASAMTSMYGVFLVLRALAGAGWAMFDTVATTSMVDHPASHRRGRMVSLLLMSETLGLLLGSTVGGWPYRHLGVASPLLIEAACTLVAAVALGWWVIPPAREALATKAFSSESRLRRDWRGLREVLRLPGIHLTSLTNSTVLAIQPALLVFLYPLYLAHEAGLGPEAIGLLTGLTVLGRLVALWFGGAASDRWGRVRVIVPGLLAYGALLGSVTLITEPILLGFWSLAIGGVAGFVAPLPAALLGDCVPPSQRGVAIGWLRTVTDTGFIIGPLVTGALADTAHLSAPFLLAATFLVLIAACWHRRAVC